MCCEIGRIYNNSSESVAYLTDDAGVLQACKGGCSQHSEGTLA